MTVTIDELIKILLKQLDDDEGLTEIQEKRLYERIISAKEAEQNEQS